jgi:hypothetical protein
MDSKKLVWHFSEFPTNFYKFLKITNFELRGGTGILQPRPREDLNPRNWVLGSSGQRSWNSPAKFQRRWSPAARGNRPGRTRGLGGNLAGGDVQVGVDRSRWNGDDPRRRQWSSTMVAVFRCAGDWRGVAVWSTSCAEVMWFGWYACWGRRMTGAAGQRWA